MTHIYEKALKFGQDHIGPRAEAIDAKQEFPADIFQELGKAGFLKLLIPEDQGGLGKRVLEHVEACLAFAQFVPSVSLCYMMHNNGIPIFYHTAREISDRVYQDVIQNHALWAAATSEPKSGNNTQSNETSFRVEKDQLILNGSKVFVTMGGYAKYYKVTARDEANQKLAWIMVPLDAEGVHFDQNSWNGLGMKGNVSCNLQLNQVTLARDHLLAYEDTVNPFDYELTENIFMLGLAATYAGIALGVCRDVVQHVQSRKFPDGNGLGDFDTVKLHLSNIYNQAQAAKVLCLEAGRAVDQQDPEAETKCSVARVFSTEAGMSAANIAMRLGGGQAYNGIGPLSRWLRDSYAGQVMIPSIDKLNLSIGKSLVDGQINLDQL